MLLGILSLLLVCSVFVDGQNSTTTTIASNATTTASLTTTTVNSTSAASSATGAPVNNCQVVAFDLRNANQSTASLVQAGDCLSTLSLTLTPIGGARVACVALQGCGVAASRKRAEINGSSEAIELQFSAPVLLWQVEFGRWQAGIDSALIEMTPLFGNGTAPSANFTTSSSRWSALATVLENGIEPPVVRRVVLRTSDNLGSFSVLSIRAKPYTAPPPVSFSAAPTPVPTSKTPTQPTTTDVAYQLKWWMENEAVFFWLVIAAIIVVLLICVGGIVIYCCCVKGDDDDETYSMRDAPKTNDDDWL
jgi:hypothetical protein